jgi:hypothetical protein
MEDLVKSQAAPPETDAPALRFGPPSRVSKTNRKKTKSLRYSNDQAMLLVALESFGVLD